MISATSLETQRVLAIDSAASAVLQNYEIPDLAAANSDEPMCRADCSAVAQANIELLDLVSHHVRCVAFQYRLHADGSSCFPYISDNVDQFFPLTAAQISADAQALLRVFTRDERRRLQASIRQCGERLVRWKQEFQTAQGGAQGRWLLGYALPKREATATLWQGVVIDITRRKTRDEQVLQMAYYDALTRLPNRRLFSERLNQAIVENRRIGAYSALLFVDLDNFKQINDMHGHAAGDQALIEAAQRLKRAVREMDTVARLGGDEFVIILRALHGDRTQAAAVAGRIAEKIRGALAASKPSTSRQDEQQAIVIEQANTASIGITLFGDHEGSQADILRRADRAMYLAKQGGRNAVRYCEQL